MLDDWARSLGHALVAGVDEVGRGPLAGPVVAAAVVLSAEHGLQGLDDSKKLTPRRREHLAPEIRERSVAWALAEVGPERIDQINIRQASLEAMTHALSAVFEKGVTPGIVLVDGLDACLLPGNAGRMEVKAFVKGDSRSQSIAAASILAKVHRDKLMLTYHQSWPVYGFDRNMGYPTASHRQAIVDRGPCPIHRRSFRGVQIDS